MNNSDYEKALKKIECDKKCRPKYFAIIGPTGPTGEIGPTGPTGADGETPTLTIGTVTTGDPGTEAEATITGTTPNFVLNLVIPQGPTGPTGENQTN